MGVRRVRRVRRFLAINYYLPILPSRYEKGALLDYYCNNMYVIIMKSEDVGFRSDFCYI